MSSQNIPLKARTDLRDPTEFWPRRPFAFELRRRGYAAQAQCKHPAASSRRRWSSICIVEMTRELRRFLPIQRCSAGGKTSNTIASLRWTFVAKRASQIILLKSRTGFRNPAEFWQPLVHGADGVSDVTAVGTRFREPCPELELAPWEQVLSE
jgi:hypothetical protein